MKAVVAAFNQEKALVGAFSVIRNLRMELFQALVVLLSFSLHQAGTPEDLRPERAAAPPGRGGAVVRPAAHTRPARDCVLQRGRGRGRGVRG